GKLVLSTIKGVGDTSQLLNQPQPPPPPMPKVSVSIQVKYDELPADVQAQLLSAGGVEMTPELAQELQAQDTIKQVPKVSTAANAASNILSAATPPDALSKTSKAVQTRINGAP